MADRVKKVTYCYVKIPNRAGQGDRILGELERAGVNLLALSGFPAGGGKTQFDLIPESMADLKRVARKNRWKLSRTKKGFVVYGGDRIGAVHRHHHKLAKAGINVIAADAVMAGGGRYGMILWVKPKDYARAARVLGAKA